jgi:hypothetical protein
LLSDDERRKLMTAAFEAARRWPARRQSWVQKLADESAADRSVGIALALVALAPFATKLSQQPPVSHPTSRPRLREAGRRGW